MSFQELKGAPKVALRSELAEHTKHWSSKPQIRKITNGVYVAIGYGIANSICIEVDNGIFIVDVILDTNSSKLVYNKFKLLCNNKAILGIIITHNHGDHLFGIQSFLENEENNGKDIPIYIHKDIGNHLKRVILTCNPILGLRSRRQFGVLMSHGIDSKIRDDKLLFSNCGIGPVLKAGYRYNKSQKEQFNVSLVELDRFTLLDEDTTIHTKSFNIDILMAPGETDDQIVVYLPSKRLLCCADNFYYAFPNLYAIRGTPPRDPTKWISSLQLFIDLEPNILVGSHCQPIIGKELIKSELILYKDSITFVHDQTVRFMNKGLHPNEIAKNVIELMPKKLLSGRCQEFYGTIEWSVRSIFNMYLGWFSGFEEDLYPSDNTTKGKLIIKLMQNVKKNNNINNTINDILNNLKLLLNDIPNPLINNSDKNNNIIAYPNERFILEMTSWLYDSYKKDKKCNVNTLNNIKSLKYLIVRRIAGRSISSNGRNYLISKWLENDYNLILYGSNAANNIKLLLPISWLIYVLKLFINPTKFGKNSRIKINTLVILNDTNKIFTLNARNCILDIKEYNLNDIKSLDRLDGMINNSDLVYKMTKIDWLSQNYGPEKCIKGKRYIEAFWSLFDFPDPNQFVPKNDKTSKL